MTLKFLMGCQPGNFTGRISLVLISRFTVIACKFVLLNYISNKGEISYKTTVKEDKSCNGYPIQLILLSIFY